VPTWAHLTRHSHVRTPTAYAPHKAQPCADANSMCTSQGTAMRGRQQHVHLTRHSHARTPTTYALSHTLKTSRPAQVQASGTGPQLLMLVVVNADRGQPHMLCSGPYKGPRPSFPQPHRRRHSPTGDVTAISTAPPTTTPLCNTLTRRC